MRIASALALALLCLTLATAAIARGGQSADDCPPGNKDPDCAGTKPSSGG
jgi:hypothetical protein